MAAAGAAGGDVLSLREIAFAHAGEAVFAGWSAEIGPGVTWIVGDEGSGKTTLLKLVAGVLTGSGTIALDGVALAASDRRPVAWCDPRDEADDALGALAFVERLRRRAPSFDAAVLDHHLDGFGLRPHLGKSMCQLSTGTRRKLGLAACFAMRAPLTLLDDPASALDAPSVSHLLRTLAAADREPARACLVAVYAVPDGFPAPQRIELRR